MAGGRIIKSKYQIIREIGRGAMGIVYEVRHEELGSTLALKQLQLNLENNPDIARRFRHEARMMARLQHSNIVRVWDIDSEAEFGTFLVMEFINGPDLGKILRTRRLTYPEVLRIGGAVASALHAAHREGLVHRDVKPANILIEEHTMRAVVTDFGIAKQIKGDTEDSTVGTVGFLGTYRYSSPEQIRSERGVSIDARADIYSLGVVLYEMYSGKKFLEGLSEGQITHLVGFHADWRPTLEYSEVPPEEFRVLIERCLVRNRDERIADAGEVARCLESCLRRADDEQRPGEQPVVHPVPPPTPAAEPATGAETAITQSPVAPPPDPHVIEEIEQLQSTLAAEVSQLRELDQEWSAIGATPADGNGGATEDLVRKLDEIEGLKEAANFESARTALGAVRLQIAAVRDRQVAGLRETLGGRLNELREQWRTLTDAAGDFVMQDQVRALESLFDSMRQALANNERQTVLRGLAEGQRVLEEVRTASLEQEATQLRTLLAHAAEAPAAIVGEMRRRAQALLDAPPADAAAALTAMEEARASLSAGLDEARAFTAADAERTAADAAQQRLFDLQPSWRQRRRATASIGKAAAAFKKRQWVAAREGYAEAIQLLAGLDAELAAERAARERVAREEAERQRAKTANDAALRSAQREADSRTAAQAPASEPTAPQPRYRWVGGTAIAAAVVSVAAWLLYPSAPTVQPPRPQPTVAARPTVPVEAKPPVPAPPRIATASPPSDTVTVREGAQQTFAVVLAGATPNEAPPIEWKLDDRVVASKVAQWDYKPGYQDGGDTPRTLTATAGNGADQTHTWHVTVEDVNRAPILGDVSPKPGSRITAKVGETLDFRVKAADADNDALRYAWTVDGKPTGGNAPELRLPVTAENQVVSLVVSDGKDSTPADWRVVASLPPLKLEFSPAQLDKLRFNEPREFALAVRPGVRAGGIQYGWSVDGQKVSDTAKFVLKDYKPAMIRDSPLVISATAQDDQGRSFSHEWKPRVTPPAPELTSSSPPPDRAVDAEPGRPQTFAMEASAPLGAQQFTYVYEVDGRRASRDGDHRFTFTPNDDSPHEIAGYVEDNYRQTSRQRVVWKLQAGSIVKRVQDWLKQYESAWNARDAATIGRLRGLKPEETKKLEDSFKEKKDLRVTFSGLKTEKLDASRAKASYTRLDEWVGKDGEPITRSRAVEQTFRLAGNQLREAGETQ